MTLAVTFTLKIANFWTLLLGAFVFHKHTQFFFLVFFLPQAWNEKKMVHPSLMVWIFWMFGIGCIVCMITVSSIDNTNEAGMRCCIWPALELNKIIQLFRRGKIFFICPSSERTYYGMMMSICPGLCPLKFSALACSILLHALTYWTETS